MNGAPPLANRADRTGAAQLPHPGNDARPTPDPGPADRRHRPADRRQTDGPERTTAMTTRLPTNPSTTDPSTARPAAPPEVLNSDPLATTVMTRDVVTITAEARVPTAVHLMAARGVRHLPVVDRGQCVGMLVETDLIRLLAKAPGPLRTGVTLTVGELRRPSRQLPPTARISDAARQMSLDASDAVLIIDQGHVLGIVTATDLVRILARDVS